MSIKPFLKWAGGKRWIVDKSEFKIPDYSGKYIEPFLGGGAVFFHHKPKHGILSDINPKLIQTYQAIKDDWEKVWTHLKAHQRHHSKEYYYSIRSKKMQTPHTSAAQFLYLNRACYNGLYRENLKGEFNVPIGTKSKILMDNDNFELTSAALKHVKLVCCDFAKTINKAKENDFLFIDPPYTVAHNYNGFVKYNQNIFSWSDQIRLRNSIRNAYEKGVKILLTNADHKSIVDLYEGLGEYNRIERHSIIGGGQRYRRGTTEALIVL